VAGHRRRVRREGRVMVKAGQRMRALPPVL
jgi:hypothetical protein